MRNALVCGAGGFIGTHLVRRLKREGFWVRGVDLKYPEFSRSEADEFLVGDLRERATCRAALDREFGEVYQLAADMGGAGYIFSGEHDAEIVSNSATINLNVLDVARRGGAGRIFFASSACVYPRHNQENADSPITSEDSAYPAAPDSEYGWEKLFSERLYLSHARNFGLDVCIGRYHNVFGPEGAWKGGREKAPAALCRKIAEVESGQTVEIWGDGHQTRSFLYIADCIEATVRLMRSPSRGPLNIGSEEMISINDLALMIMETAGKTVSLKHIPGPVGVRGRSSDNRLTSVELGWVPRVTLRRGIAATYPWILGRVLGDRRAAAPASTGVAW
jgi:nucleoside-diphosphate-sugar epimerase